MAFVDWIKNVLGLNQPAVQPVEIVYDEKTDSLPKISDEIQGMSEDIIKFKLENIVFEKLNYLEEYIKSFSTTFPNDYNRFLLIIQAHRKNYESDLENYRNGLAGKLTTAIDPEVDSHYSALTTLENQINDFVDFVVHFEMHKKKFITLCSRLNEFYNTVVNCHIDEDKVQKQFLNASKKAKELISEVQVFKFFTKDSRKREEILNYVIYCDYMLFKIALRYSFCRDFVDYKDNVSKLIDFFVEKDYDKLMFKFLAQDLEQIEQFITSKLQSYECHDFLILSCNKLKTDTRDFLHSNLSPEYFDKLIKLENTLEEAAKIVGQDFVVQMPSTFNQTTTVETINVNEMAIGILKLVNKPSAKILLSIVEAFTINITWEEFYFLCKIFELYDEISKVAKNTVFSSVYDNFVTLDNKYPDYSHEYITKYKMRLLNYKGSQKKKYVLLFKVREVDTVVVTTELMSLLLDFVVIDGAIYIHHSYFNGFANLEIMFGNYITV